MIGIFLPRLSCHPHGNRRPIISTLAQEELLGRTVSHPGSGSSVSAVSYSVAFMGLVI